MASVFHLITGKDISTKLYQIQELLLTNPNYMQSTSSRQSSIVNLRSAIVSNSSDPNLNKLNCFGINLKGRDFVVFYSYFRKKSIFLCQIFVNTYTWNMYICI